MKHVYILFLLCLSLQTAAQRTAGLTHQPDTSFTNYTAYISTLKNYPQITRVSEALPKSVKVQKNITYTGALQLDVFYPAKKRAHRAAILIIHGGGWRTGNRTQHHALAIRLADEGYVCFTPSYRLSTEALYPAAVHDLKAAIRWVKANNKKYGVDTAKVVALGFSAGGQLAALLGASSGVAALEAGDTAYGSNVKAVVDIDGILAFIHPESGEGNDTKSVSAATNWFGYSKEENPALWKQGSALTYVGPNTPPTLFLNSEAARMHAGREDYIRQLTQYHIYTEVHEFKAPHAFCLFEPWFTPTVNYITAFLEKVL